MKRIIITKMLFVLLLTTGFIACEKIDIAKDTPHEIKKMIRSGTKHGGIEQVIEYEYNNGMLYLFICDFIDGTTKLYDAKGNYLCEYGGFSGSSPEDTECNVYFKTMIEKRVVWEKTKK
jgi:hypothetical protein